MNEIRKLIEAIEKIEEAGEILPRQDSTKDQLKDLIPIAVEHGMYDAADYIELVLKNQFKSIKIEEAEESEVDLKLPRGKKIILEAEEDDYRRGLIVEFKEEGGYDVEYWVKDPSNVYPSEVKVDGESVKKDAKLVYLGFHPEKGDVEENIIAEKINANELYKYINANYYIYGVDIVDSDEIRLTIEEENIPFDVSAGNYYQGGSWVSVETWSDDPYSNKRAKELEKEFKGVVKINED